MESGLKEEDSICAPILLFFIALAIACFAVAQSLHGSGYIAAFTGGLLFGFLAKDATHRLVLTGEGIGETLALATWMMFGAIVIPQALPLLSGQVAVYAVLSLTVVRMVPIFLSLARSCPWHLRPSAGEMDWA